MFRRTGEANQSHWTKPERSAFRSRRPQMQKSVQYKWPCRVSVWPLLLPTSCTHSPCVTAKKYVLMDMVHHVAIQSYNTNRIHLFVVLLLVILPIGLFESWIWNINTVRHAVSIHRRSHTHCFYPYIWYIQKRLVAQTWARILWLLVIASMIRDLFSTFVFPCRPQFQCRFLFQYFLAQQV